MVKHLNLTVLHIASLNVMIGDGSKLVCEGQCLDVPVNIQGIHFLVPFYVLPIEEAEMVLGVQ